MLVKPFSYFAVVLLFALVVFVKPSLAQGVLGERNTGDRDLANYFSRETAKLTDNCLAEIKTLEDWEKQRGEKRRQLFEMLGLDPLPKRTLLNATTTAVTKGDGFLVERLHFQSSPGLYVTGNLYLPKKLEGPAPAILYVCGHGGVKVDGVSYGNKVHYHHHGSWFARNGYVCLTIDSLQLGEIEAIHHGTYRYNMWWWLSRGYTPAGVEAWNCIRALDYLQSRKEVDGEKIGVTGRSGGGAYSWWIAALDERVKCAVPVAGITDLENHVVDGCVEGHCDCMFMVNTYQWDYPMVAALVAPRPLLISNTDRDRIFPLDGVVRTHRKVRRIYDLYGAGDKLALHITAGPHKDTQELRIHAFRWFNHYLKGTDELIADPAVERFEPKQLQVFQTLPKDALNAKIHETFVPLAENKLPDSEAMWREQTQQWRTAMKEKVFRGWPAIDAKSELREHIGFAGAPIELTRYDFTSEEGVELRLIVTHKDGLEKPKGIILQVHAEDDRPNKEWQQSQWDDGWILAEFFPRGSGATAFDPAPKKQIQNRRRFYLLGHTLHSVQTYDIVRAAAALRSKPEYAKLPLKLYAKTEAAGLCVYAALHIPDVASVELVDPPVTHREGPYYLNVMRYFDMPQALAMVAEHANVTITTAQPAAWEYPQEVANRLKWKKECFNLVKTAGK